ncbi:MAG: hypothetical protein ACK555_13025 [Acidobacteriota bacterium]
MLLLLIASSLCAQSILSISPSGDRPAPAAPCPECSALAALDGFGLDPLLSIRFSAPVNADLWRERIFIEWGASRQTDAFPTYPAGYRMPVGRLAWDPVNNTLYARPDDPLDHDRDYRIVVTEGAREIASARFHTANITRPLLERRLGPAGSLRRDLDNPIDLASVRSLRARTQIAADPAAPLVDVPFPAEAGFLTQLGLRRLVFLTYESPRGERIGVHAWLPNSPKPAAGWPVKLIGHGLGDSRLLGPTLFSSGFIGESVVMAIDAVGHGQGPNSRIRFEFTDGAATEVPLYGRGRDLNGDGLIDPAEGCIVIAPGNIDFLNTCLRETALDYAKLVREIQQNIDLDGDRIPDLNPNSIQYLGQSLGAMYGTLLTAIEPSIDAAVLNVGGGSAGEIARTSTSLSSIFSGYVAAFYPSLVGVTDPRPARFAPAVTITPRQAQLLEVFDRLATLEAPAAPASFAPLLKQGTLYGSPIKRVLFQLALGDQTIPNNANTQLIRAAHEFELVSLYRHDLARRAVPALPENPHAYLAGFGQFDPPNLLIALATLQQANLFLSSPTREVPDVNGLVRVLFRANLFETPERLPE